MRTLGFVLLALLAGCGGGSDVPPPGPSAPAAEPHRMTARDFASLSAHSRLDYRIERSYRGLPLQRTDLYVTCVGPTTFFGESAVEYRQVFQSIRLRGNGTPRTLWIYQSVTESAIRSLGVKRSDGTLFQEEVPYVYLQGPIETGTKWAFFSENSLMHPEVRGTFTFKNDAAIEEVGVAVEILAGAFEECILVHLRGTTVDTVTVVSRDAPTVRCRVTKDQKRWLAPGVGPVKEMTREEYYSLQTPDRLIDRFDSVAELKKRIP